MTDEKKYIKIFKQGSRTFYNATSFFPVKIRKQVTRLYAFVRRADDYVDAIPQNKEEFYNFKNYFLNLRLGTLADNLTISETDKAIIASFVDLEKELEFDPKWTDAFLESMEMDLTKKTYQSLDETLYYIYGSASVIGLYMARILKLPLQSYRSAEFLGQAFQYINFIRDIAEDIELDRNYFPQELMKKHNLSSLKYHEARKKPDNFKAFAGEVIDQYLVWEQEGKKGFKYIPYKYRVAIKTATQMYHWTAIEIAKNPFIVYKKKVKPSKLFILATGLRNLIFSR